MSTFVKTQKKRDQKMIENGTFLSFEKGMGS